MKTQILQLEIYDDLVSTCDKMKWAKADRILLVWPAKKKILNRKLDLLILKRQSIAQGSQLALVIRDRALQGLAHQQGIPTFRTIRRAQSTVWRLPHRYRHLQSYSGPIGGDLTTHREIGFQITENNQPDRRVNQKTAIQHPIVRLLIFMIGVFAFLTIAAILFPAATITLQPVAQWQETSLVIIPDEQNSSITIDGKAPIHKAQVIVEGRDSLRVNGSVLFPENHAEGVVLFSNLTDLPLEIPEETVVRSAGGDRFTTIKAARLETGDDSTTTVPVRSILPGSSGNLPAGSIETVEGSLNTFVRVTNPEGFRSGTDRLLPSATNNDRTKLVQKLNEELLISADQQIRQQLSTKDLLIPGSLKLVQTLDQSFIPTENIPTNQLTLNLRLEYEASYISGNDLIKLFDLVFNAVPQTGFEVISGSFEYDIEPDTGNSKTPLEGIRLTGRRKLKMIYNTSKIASQILGLPPAQADVRLSEQYTLQNAPRIQITPDWWPVLPFIPLRITIQVID